MVKTNANYPKMNNTTNYNTSKGTSTPVNRNVNNKGNYSGNNYSNNNGYIKKTETMNFTSNYNVAAEQKRKEREASILRFQNMLKQAELASNIVSVKSLREYSTNMNGSTKIREVNRLVGSRSNYADNYDINVTGNNGSIFIRGSEYVRVFSDGSYKFYVDGELRNFPILDDEKVSKFVNVNRIKEIHKNGASTDIVMKDGSITHIIEGTNTFICGEDKDGNFNYAYHVEEDGSLTNIDIYGSYTEANGQFGGNQTDLELNAWNLLNDEKLMEELERSFPGTTWCEKASYLQDISHSACGFTGEVNSIFSKYIGHEKEFKEKFGYDMYKIDCNGNLDFNYENMIVSFYDYYLTKKNGNNIYNARANADGFYPECTQEFSNYLAENYGISSYAENYLTDEDRESGAEISRIYTKDDILNVYHSYEEQGKDNIMIGSWGYHLRDYDTGATTYYSRDGDGHAMTVLGEENGNLIVTSWGEKYILDLDYMGSYNEAFSYFYTTDYE
jgi:hypothetical protein